MNNNKFKHISRNTIHETLFTIVLILLILSMISCTKNQNEKTLKISLSSQPTSLDPAFTTSVHGGKITCMIFNRLVQFNNQFELKSDLAKSWNISDDLKTYTFYLFKNKQFSDGSNFTAQDVAYSFQRVMNPETKSPRSWIFDKIDSIQIIDRFQIQIHLKESFSPFLSLLTMPNASIVKELPDSVIGTGPLILDKWIHDQEIILKKNPYHSTVLPFDKVMYRIQPEALTRSTDFELGQTHIMDIPHSETIYYHDHSKWKKQIQKTLGLNTYYLGMNCFKGPLQDVKLRKHIRNHINPELILNTILHNKATQANSIIPTTLLNTQSKHTIDLKKTKWTTPLKLRLLQSHKSENSIITQVFQDQLKKAGIDIEIVSLEWSTFKSKIVEGDYDLFYLSWWADYPDPENFITPLFSSKNHGAGGNYTRINDPLIDQLIEKAQITKNHSHRNEIYNQILSRIDELSPLIPLWHKTQSIIIQPNIKNYNLSPIYTIPDILNIDWTLEK